MNEHQAIDSTKLAYNQCLHLDRSVSQISPQDNICLPRARAYYIHRLRHPSRPIISHSTPPQSISHGSRLQRRAIQVPHLLHPLQQQRQSRLRPSSNRMQDRQQRRGRQTLRAHDARARHWEFSQTIFVSHESRPLDRCGCEAQVSTI